MYPTICKIGPLTVYSYGLMIAIAVVVCSFLAGRQAKVIGIAPEKIYDFTFFVVCGGILGARLFYIILNYEYFLTFPHEVVMVHNGGLAWQGGLIGGFLTGNWFIKRNQLSGLQVLDLAAPFIALGQSIGRFGCFLNGCCYGKPVAWGIYFPVHMDHLHPTQLYLTGGYFLIFLILTQLLSKDLKSGMLFCYYLIGATVLRFVVEFFRGDHYNTLLGLSVYQFVSIAIFTSAVIALFKINNRAQ